MRFFASSMFRYTQLFEYVVVLLMGLASHGSMFADEQEHYLKSVKPVLQSRCFACHGALKQEANLRLDTVASMLRGGSSGQAIHSGDASTSLMVERIAAHEESSRMPPEGEPLLASQIEAIRKWLNDGAIAPPDEQPERDPREHWAFVAPIRPSVPQNGATNPIDAFLLEKHLEKGLVPQQDAEPAIWLRRVSLDLVGLPPTSDELKNFELDHAPQAQRLVVERLLNSPHYGERWGRHWMDIWRYSDWWGLGEEVRNSQKHMWHWRDWIVESLNTDQGYDQMLQDMLAADELHPNDLGRLRASGFLARQYFKFNRTSWLDETIEHTSKAMMGLTFNCCKCHDHKYDPISQEDYYRLRAVFEPYQIRQEMTPSGIDFQKDAIPRAFDCNLELPTYVHTRGDDRNPNTSRSMEPSVPAILRWEPFSILPVSLPKEASEPGLRVFVEEAYRRDAESNWMAAQKKASETKQQLDKAQAVPSSESETENAARKTAIDVATAEFVIADKSAEKWRLELEAIPKRFAADRARHGETSTEVLGQLVRAAAFSELNLALTKAEEGVARAELESLKSKPETKEASEKKVADARTALELAKKQSDAPGEVYVSMRGAEKSAESNLESEESRTKAFPKTSTGRRSALARWLIDRRNPLTARVAVNHLWSRHFGRPIVATVFDFGRKGTEPTNQKLLDWLAVELMDSNWSLKHIHRIILSSDAYRRTSSNRNADPKNLALDADNQFLWRMNATRMESQMVRDSLLSLAGELDLKIGGPPIPAADEKSRRRSLYFFHSHNEHNKLLSAFDDANVLDCYRRGESIVPQQALALENSRLAMEMVEQIAKKLTDENPMAADVDFARTAFVRLLASEPSHAELEWMETSMQKIRSLSENASSENAAKQARLGLIRGLVNHNDFITIR
jgi:Protein of unknown function (DUF1553)/Protein of unknown function (DUF1549)/Planctomycete cytochrome C